METVPSKKKVLYFIPEFPRLTETFIEREVSWLIERGNLDVTVFSLKKASGKTTENVLKNTVYKRLGVLEMVSGLFLAVKAPQKASEAVKMVLRDTSKTFLDRFYLLLKSIGYAGMFSRLHPDHIHAHFLSDPSTVALVASIMLNIPFSVSGHARDVFIDGTLITEKIQKAKFVALCNSMAFKRCIELAGEKDKHKVYKIYHGMDAGKIENAVQHREPDEPGKKSYILTVARLVEKKGLQYLIEASEILKDQGTAHEMHIVGGPGDLYQELSELIKQKGLENTVFIEGEGRGLPNEQVLALYGKADMFILPSIETAAGDVDGIPNVIVEAALAKLPIITTDAGAITDLIQTGETGFIVNQKDAQAIAVQAYKLINNKELRKQIGQKAFEKAGQMFNMENNVGQMERLFLL